MLYKKILINYYNFLNKITKYEINLFEKKQFFFNKYYKNLIITLMFCLINVSRKKICIFNKAQQSLKKYKQKI